MGATPLTLTSTPATRDPEVLTPGSRGRALDSGLQAQPPESQPRCGRCPGLQGPPQGRAEPRSDLISPFPSLSCFPVSRENGKLLEPPPRPSPAQGPEAGASFLSRGARPRGCRPRGSCELERARRSARCCFRPPLVSSSRGRLQCTVTGLPVCRVRGRGKAPAPCLGHALCPNSAGQGAPCLVSLSFPFPPSLRLNGPDSSSRAPSAAPERARPGWGWPRLPWFPPLFYFGHARLWHRVWGVGVGGPASWKGPGRAPWGPAQALVGLS